MDNSQIQTSFKSFRTTDLKLIEPHFGSKVTDLIIELEKLREIRVRTELPYLLFYQLKEVFHILESVENNRFEGNPTTVADFIETKIQPDKRVKDDEHYIAISNTEKALEYIEEHMKLGEKITAQFIREIHRIVVTGLTPLPDGEGSENPGNYKKRGNTVGDHVTPPPSLIGVYMNELEEFINKNVAKKYQLIVTAIAHHRFVWIHPFDNGNGRVVRLLTYAMLIKQGFINTDFKVLQLINPTGIFGSKKKYSKLLGKCEIKEKSQKSIKKGNVQPGEAKKNKELYYELCSKRGKVYRKYYMNSSGNSVL